MAVYYKFKSEREVHSFPIEGTFISVKQLKKELLASIYKPTKRNPFDDLVLLNPQTNEEYHNDAANIPRHASILIRRVPKVRWNPIVVEPNRAQVVPDDEVVQEPTCKFAANSSAVRRPHDDSDDFGDDIYAVPAVPPAQSNVKTDHHHACNSQSTTTVGFGHHGGMERNKPTHSYVWHRCREPEQFIKPKVAVLKPIETVMKKELEMLPSASQISSFPQELQCPLCKKLMREAMLTRCCFGSFCAKCIGDYLISNSACICGRTNTKPDDLIPNRTLREFIIRIESSRSSSSSSSCGSSSSVTSESMVKLQDVKATHQANSKAPDTLPMVFKDEHRQLSAGDSAGRKRKDCASSFPVAQGASKKSALCR